jgi:hypothetical protein
MWTRTASPTSITPSNTPRAISVRWAVLTRGLRKAGTPLAIASTPVTAEQPAAKALSSSTIPSAWVPGARLLPMIASLWEWTSPITIVVRTLTMKIAAGNSSSLADSAIPNMLTAVRIASPISDTSSR